MSEEITKKVREIYDSIMYFPHKVLDIFNDFFGEERVDLQGFLTFDSFKTKLETHNLSYFFSNKSNLYNTVEFKALPKESKDTIVSLIENNNAWDTPVLENDTIASYILPLMTSTLPNVIGDNNYNNCFILVHFPHVRVTNENNRYVDITHLWVKVYIKSNGAGRGYFSMNRSEYPLSHMRADYMHSHCSGIPFSNFQSFKSPCLGTGPIKNTLATLALGFDEAMWNLFCLELDRYVRVESLAGVPYRYLEKIGSKSNMSKGSTSFDTVKTFSDYWSGFTREDIKDFVKFLIQGKKLKFNFVNGSYGFAMSYLDFRILVSNEFIKWYNHKFNEELLTCSYAQLISNRLIIKCIIDNNVIYCLSTANNSGRDYWEYEGKLVCTFKGNPITVHIIDDSVSENTNYTVLINGVLASNIAKAILETINYKYGREERREEVGADTSAVYL